MPQYAVLIYAQDSSHALDASAADLADADRHAEELAESGAMVAGWAFTPRALAKSIRADGVTDGIFDGGASTVAGIYILDAPDEQTALAIAGFADRGGLYRA